MLTQGVYRVHSRPESPEYTPHPQITIVTSVFISFSLYAQVFRHIKSPHIFWLLHFFVYISGVTRTERETNPFPLCIAKFVEFCHRYPLLFVAWCLLALTTLPYLCLLFPDIHILKQRNFKSCFFNYSFRRNAGKRSIARIHVCCV